MVLDEQHGLGFAGNQQLVANVVLAGQVEMAAIHQVAGDRLERIDFRDRVGRLVETVEDQEHAAAMRRQPVDRDGRFGDQRERAFAADEQLGEIELAVARARRRARSRCD